MTPPARAALQSNPAGARYSAAGFDFTKRLLVAEPPFRH